MASPAIKAAAVRALLASHRVLTSLFSEWGALVDVEDAAVGLAGQLDSDLEEEEPTKVHML